MIIYKLGWHPVIVPIGLPYGMPNVAKVHDVVRASVSVNLRGTTPKALLMGQSTHNVLRHATLIASF
jgi:hypothetical protein